MKAYGTTAVSYLKGRDSTSVYYGEPRRKYSIIRKYIIPRYTTNNELRGNELKNIGIQWRGTTAGYKTSGKTYMQRYLQQHPPLTEDKQNPSNFFAMWIKALHKWFDSDTTHVDLTTFELHEAAILEPTIVTIAGMIALGFLPNVTPLTDLSVDWDT